MSRSRQIAINAASQWGVTILSATLGLVLVPFLITKLGKDGYGLIAVTMAIAGVCALADLGISGALGRQLAEALAKKDDGKYRELLSTALGIDLLMGLTCAGAVFLLADQLARFFALPPPLFHTGVFLLRTYGAAHVLFTFLMPAPKAVVASHNRFDASSRIDAVRRLCETAGLFLVLASTSAGIAGWAAVCVTTDAVCLVLLWRAAAKTHTDLAVGVSTMRLSSVKELYRLGSQFTLMQLGGQLSTHSDPFILTACLGPAGVSLYRPPSQVLGAVWPVVMTLSNQMHPLATNAHVKGDKQDLAAILFRGTKYTMLMGATVCGALLPLAHPLCRVWLGTALGEQYKVCAAVLIIETVTTLFYFCTGTQWPILLGMKKIGFASGGKLALGVLNIAASWMLVRYTGLGVIGVVLPTMVIEAIWRPVLAIYVCRLLGVSMLEYFRQSYKDPLLVGAAVAVSGFVLRWATVAETVPGVLTLGFLLAMLAAWATWEIGFGDLERSAVRRSAPVRRWVAQVR